MLECGVTGTSIEGFGSRGARAHRDHCKRAEANGGTEPSSHNVLATSKPSIPQMSHYNLPIANREMLTYYLAGYYLSAIAIRATRCSHRKRAGLSAVRYLRCTMELPAP